MRSNIVMGSFSGAALGVRAPLTAELTALLAAADAAAACNDRAAAIAAVQSIYAYFAEQPRPGVALAALHPIRRRSAK